MTHPVHTLAVIALAGAVLLSGGATWAAASEDPDWPCIQRLMPEISPATVWGGPPLDNAARAWHETPAIRDLVATIASRRTPLEDGEKAIAAFAGTLGAEKDAMLTMVFAGLSTTINEERSRIISGIKRYARGQRRRASRIRQLTADLGAAPADGTPEGAARRRQLRERWVWDTRIFEERERSLKALCEQPVVLERRLFILARAIMAQMDE
ncbi:MAG: hypothetical protein ACE5GT_05285 [Rhodospirillales bacterium]